MTKKQQEADAFDCDLYRLIVRAGRFSERDGYGGPWRQVELALNRVRPTVRNMMDGKRRAETAA